jgi:hypothetical protein
VFRQKGCEYDRLDFEDRWEWFNTMAARAETVTQKFLGYELKAGIVFS